MSKREETVEVTVKLPKAIVDFLEALGHDIKHYIVKNTIGAAISDLESTDFSTPLLIRKYNLKLVLQKYDPSICKQYDP